VRKAAIGIRQSALGYVKGSNPPGTVGQSVQEAGSGRATDSSVSFDRHPLNRFLVLLVDCADFTRFVSLFPVT